MVARVKDEFAKRDVKVIALSVDGMESHKKRNFNEIFRVIDSLQLTAYHKAAIPFNWKNGKDCVILPAVTSEEIP